MCASTLTHSRAVPPPGDALSVIRTSSSASVALDDAGQANPDFDFRFDPSLGGAGGYVFNLKKTGYATGAYVLNYSVGGDPTAPYCFW